MAAPAPLRSLLLTLLALAGCRGEGPPAGQASAKEGELPPSIRVTAERQDLIFSYPVDGGRAFATATRIDEVPEAARSSVVVTDLSLTPEQRQAGSYVYLADLSSPREDGSFAVALASRHAFEASLTGTSTTVAVTGSGREVVMYSASWCGVCKRARRVLEAMRVPFVEKDIEASRSASKELAAKAAARGVQPGGVPVFDVGGQLLLGFDEQALGAAIRAAGLLPQ